MGLGNVAKFKEILATYESDGAGTLDFSTDLPGSALSIRKTKTLATTARERHTEPIPLDGLEGSIHKTLVTPTGSTILVLYALRLRLKVYGVYLDAAKSEFYETEELAI